MRPKVDLAEPVADAGERYLPMIEEVRNHGPINKRLHQSEVSNEFVPLPGELRSCAFAGNARLDLLYCHSVLGVVSAHVAGSGTDDDLADIDIRRLVDGETDHSAFLP